MKPTIIQKINTFLKSILGKSDLLRPMLLLVGGTAFGHAITALSLPILTRLYAPNDFATLAIFTSLISLLSVAACLRFDIAIPIPERDNEAFNLLVLAIACVVGISSLIGLFTISTPEWLPELMGRPDLKPYLWLLPFGVLLTGVYSGLQNWFVRKKNFSLIASSRVAQSATCAGTQIGLASLSPGPFGLLFGYLLNTGSACVIFGYRLLKQNSFGPSCEKVTKLTLKHAYKSYDRFPKYSTWESLANSAAFQLPILMIAALTLGAEAGYLLLAMSVIQAPMALFGGSLGQVYLSRAPEEYRTNHLGIFTADILSGLIKVGVGPLIFIGILSPILFEYIFGEGWGRAGWLAAMMTPWFVMQFLAGPVSTALYITGNQRAIFLLQIFGLLLRVSSVWCAAQLMSKPVSEAYALSGAIFYLIYLCLVMRCVKCSWKLLISKLGNGPVILGAWFLSAVILLMAWKYLKVS